MAGQFSFGGFSVKSKLKHANLDKTNILLVDNFNEEFNYFIFLLSQKPSDEELKLLQIDIERKGFASYVILLATPLTFDSSKTDAEKKEERGTLVDFYDANESDWKKYIVYNNKHCKAIMAFGAALYAINKSVDLIWTDFLADDWFNSYFYLGRGYIGDFDCHVFPISEINKIYQKDKKGKIAEDFWIRNFFNAQLTKMKAIRAYEYPDLQEIKLHLITSKEEADNILKENMNSELMSVDTETTGLHHVLNKVFSIQCCWNGIDGYFFPVEIINKRLLSACLKSAKHTVSSNIKFDTKMLYKLGVSREWVPTDSTDLLAHTLHSTRPKGLKPLTFLYTYFGGYEYQLNDFKKQTGLGKDGHYEKIRYDILYKYATIDAISTYRVYTALINLMRKLDVKYPNEKLPEWTLEKFYRQIIIPRMRLQARSVEYEGMYIDVNLMNKNRETLLQKADELEKQIYEIWNINENWEKVKKDLQLKNDNPKKKLKAIEKFNLEGLQKFELNSPLKLGLLLEYIGFPCIERAKAGNYMTNDFCLIAWKKEIKKDSEKLKNYKKAIKLLDEWRTIRVFIQTFLGQGTYDETDSGWGNLIIHCKDGTDRMFQGYQCMLTNTFRDKGHSPNLQQLPIHSKLAQYVINPISVPGFQGYQITNSDNKKFRFPLQVKQVDTNKGTIDIKDFTSEYEIIETEEMLKYAV
jgi:DNA polymerase I-like protein with 3'-5' exonuclease and polymerase domains